MGSVLNRLVVKILQLAKMYQDERSQDFLKPRDIACLLQIALWASVSLVIHQVLGWMEPVHICFVYQKAAEDIVHDLSKN